MKRVNHISATALLTLLLTFVVVSTAVASKPQKSKKGEQIDVFVETRLSKNMVHVDDTLQLTYTLYSTMDVDRILEVNLPYLRDFYTASFDLANTKEVRRDGKVYKAYELKRVVLQPKKIGELTIPEGDILIRYAIPTGKKRRDYWGYEYELYEQKELEVKAPAVTLQAHNMKAI